MTAEIQRNKNRTMNKNSGLLILAWSLIIMISLIWNLYVLNKEILSMAKTAAITNLDRDLNFRRWGTSHGGVYVPPTRETPPNPYLNVPNRDVVTTGGKTLTLMNPAYMLRQLTKSFPDPNGIVSHITSLNALNPENAPDKWEAETLRKFEKGEKSATYTLQMDGKPYLRYMRPLVTEAGCLKCHGFQGYKVGDVRGGVSSTVPLTMFDLHKKNRILQLGMSHTLIWFAGLFGIIVWIRRSNKLNAIRLRTEEALKSSEARFRSMFHKHSAVMLLIDPDTGKIINANDAAEVFYGYPINELTNMNISDINILPHEQIIDEMNKARLRKESYFVFPHKLANDDVRTVEVYSSPIDTGDKVVLFSVIHDITERKKAERQFLELNRDFITFLENTPDFIYFKDESSRFRFCSQTLANITGHSSWREMIGKHDLEVFPPEIARIYYEEEFPVFREGKPLLNKIDPYIDAHGNKRWVNTHKWPVFDADGKKVTGIFGISRDITEKLEAENALKISESRYRTYIEFTSNVAWITSSEGIVTEEIPSFQKFTGMSFDEVKGLGWLNAIHPDDREKTRTGWLAAVDSKREYNIEYRLRRYDGEYRDMATRGVPIYNEDSSLREWVGTGVDITERKKAEDKLRRSEQSLNDAQRITHLGSWDFDIVNNVLAWSDEFYRIYEIDPKEFGASYEAFLAAVHPDDREWVDKAYTESVANKTPYNIVHRLLMKDGRIKYIHEIGVTTYDENGRPLRTIGTGQDITERKLAEEKIRQMNEELERRVAERTAQLETANRELEAFSYSVSHDLRTPLRAIDGFSQILMDDFSQNINPEASRLLGIIRENTEKMSQLIDDILHFSRTGRAEMSVAEIDMNSIVNEVISALEPETSSRNVEFRVEKLPMAKCDRALIRQVFENLISNAIKFTSRKEKAVIEIGGIKESGFFQYYIKDNGAGFDSRYKEKLFGVFQRLHGTDQFEGTGIGLAIVKRIISRHGGTVRAEGSVDQGATFYFTLPEAVN